MKRLTVSIEDDQYADIGDEADERGVSKSQVVRERLRSGEDVVDGAVNSGEDVVKLRERIGDVEQRVNELEGKSPPTAQNASDSPVSDPSGETMETPDRPDETARSGGGTAPVNSDGVDEDLEAAWEQWIEAEGPNTVHGKEMMRDFLDRLRREQIVATGELREAWYEEWPDAYGTEKSLWDSMKRHVQAAPGVEHPGTGQWRYAGDDALQKELGEYVSSDN